MKTEGTWKFRMSRQGANKLFNWLKAEKCIRTDRQLADELDTRQFDISKIRNGHMLLGPTLLLSIHLYTDKPVKELIKIAEGE